MIHDLKADDVRRATISLLSEHIQLETEGYQINTPMTWQALIKAAVEHSSIEATSQDLVELVHGNTLREYLNENFDVCTLMQHELEQNRVLAATIPRELSGRAVDVAIDFHDEPYYGKSGEAQLYVCRGKADKGTTRFWRIATAYVMWGALRVTLALTYVLPEHQPLTSVKSLLHRVAAHGVRVKTLFMDKGFCSTALIQYLQDQQQPAVLACPIRGKAGGTRAPCQGRGSYRTPYTFTDGTTVDLALVATLPPGQDGKRRRKWLAFVVIGRPQWSPQKVMRRYRRRFGIESSYRQMRALRIFTNARNPAWRFFILGFALLLLNIWRWLRWQFTRLLKPGPYRINPTAFRLRRFISFLRRAIDLLFQPVMSIPTYLPPEIVIH